MGKNCHIGGQIFIQQSNNSQISYFNQNKNRMQYYKNSLKWSIDLKDRAKENSRELLELIFIPQCYKCYVKEQKSWVINKVPSLGDWVK